MLTLVISPPGTGKTAHITRRLKAGSLLIVPEQSHFETERMIYKRLGARAFAGIEIVSFTKLCADITALYKREQAPCVYAEDTMREITMLRAVRKVQERLTFYKDNSSQGVSFISRMLGAIGLFQREALSPRELSEYAGGIAAPRLKNKIADLALIYESYNELLAFGNFADKQDEVRVAAQFAREHKYFAGKSIYADSFDGFTGGQFKLLEIALGQAANLVITLTADRFGSTDSRYTATAKLAQKLKESADKRGVRFTAEAPEEFLPERDPDSSTEIYKLADIYAESNFVAAKIRELITAHNYTQSDIAVLNPPSVQTLEGAFAAYGITGFSDIPEPIIEKPVIRFIITVLEAADSDLSKAGALTELIRSGFMRISATAAAGSRKPSGLRKIIGKRTADYVARGRTCRLSRAQIRLLIREEGTGRTELIRAEIVSKLAALSQKITDTTGDKITEALADFLLVDLELGRTVADIVYMSRMDGEVDSALNDEYRLLWEKMIAVFEGVHGAFKDESVSPADYTAILKSIFGKTTVAKPPQVLDCVTVGDLRRTRTGDVKAVFLMGANQGEFPRNTFAGGMEFTADEAEKLSVAGIFIDEEFSRADRYHRERFLINRAMTLPTEKLFITAPLRDAAFKEKKLSALFSQQEHKLKDAAELPLSFWAGHGTALKLAAVEKPHESALQRALKAVSPDEYERVFLKPNCTHLHQINPESAQLLMRRGGYSPSRIETLNTCLFRYFCAHGLRISSSRNQNGAEPDALTRGNMTHYVLEKVLRDYGQFMNTKPAEFINTAEKYIAEFERKAFGTRARSARQKEILLAHSAGIAEVLKQMREDFALSDFKPFEFEKEFELVLGGIKVRGKIDRVDVSDAAKSVRVIDYKTGAKEFSYPEIELGLNLQALIYLFAVASLNDNYKPSGAFYRLVNGGRLTVGFKAYGARQSSDDLYKNRLETQKTTGLHFGEISSDIELVNSRMKLNSASRKEFIKLESFEEAQFAELADKTAKQLTERLGALHGGDVRAVPAYSKVSPCDYCDYKSICNNAGKREEVRV
jgi:ATP-dependent helicase/nuclease subunit B